MDLPRTSYQAHVAGIDAAGNIILEDLQTPRGLVRHLWVPRTTWPGFSRMLIGMEVRFVASVHEYRKKDGVDLGLCDIENIQVI